MFKIPPRYSEVVLLRREVAAMRREMAALASQVADLRRPERGTWLRTRAPDFLEPAPQPAPQDEEETTSLEHPSWLQQLLSSSRQA